MVGWRSLNWATISPTVWGDFWAKKDKIRPRVGSDTIDRQFWQKLSFNINQLYH